MPLDDFHPAVSAWFARAFTAPTEPQRFAWPAIASGIYSWDTNNQSPPEGK